MITKTTTIDEERIYSEILSKLDNKYTLVYIDYRDELSPNHIQSCLEAKSLQPLYEEDVYTEARCYYAREILDGLLAEHYTKDETELFKGTDEYLELLRIIEERDDSTPEHELFSKTRITAYIRFHSNYDCWLPLWEQGGIQAEGTALGGIMAALSLNPRKVKEAAIKKGIEVIGPFKNIPSREGKELVNYDGFIRVLCETPNYGNWAFFGMLEGDELIGSRFNIDEMTIPTKTTTAMFNWWNGGGSLDFCETVRPIKVKELRKRLNRYKDDLKLIIDDKSLNKYGYTPSDVYGGKVSTNTLLTI